MKNDNVLHVRVSFFKVELTKRDSAIFEAPSGPISLSICCIEKKNHNPKKKIVIFNLLLS